MRIHVKGTVDVAKKFGAVLLLLIGCAGCKCGIEQGIPARQVSPHWLALPKACQRPIDLTLLRKDPLPEHLIQRGDVLGVYAEGIISGKELSSGASEMPSVNYYSRDSKDSATEWPSLGQPFTVQDNGMIRLPLIEPVQVVGMTMTQAANAIRMAYVADGQLKADPNSSFAQVSLIRSRLNRVLVVREDCPAETTGTISRDQYVVSKRGAAAIVDLVPQESDLLHALIATGGLPGEDAKNDVWILRGGSSSSWQRATHQFDQGIAPEQIDCAGSLVVIPLRYQCGTPLPFAREDAFLNDGDVVFIEKREESHFYTGGLLNAGRIPLPRDEDIDVLEAIALANDGVFGLSGQIAINNRAPLTRGPGNLSPPTRAQVIRRLADGQQVIIEVDLRAATANAVERILIQPDDFIMLHYRPGELLTNVALNFFNFGYAFTTQTN